MATCSMDVGDRLQEGSSGGNGDAERRVAVGPHVTALRQVYKVWMSLRFSFPWVWLERSLLDLHHWDRISAVLLVPELGNEISDRSFRVARQCRAGRVG